MPHEVLITRRQSIFNFLQIQAEAGLSSQCIKCVYILAAKANLCLDFQKKNLNALTSGYQDLTGHLVLTTSPLSILT